MNKVTVVTSYKNDAGTIIVKSEEVQGDAELNVRRPGIPSGSIDAEFDIAFAAATLQAVGMGCSKTRETPPQAVDKTAKLTVKTNSKTTPDNTFLLTPSNGIGWTSGDPTPNPFGTDVTKLFVTVTGTANTDFSLDLLIDSTPALPG